MSKTNDKKNPATVYLSKWPKNGDTRKTMHRALHKVVEVLSPEINSPPSDVETFSWQKLRYEDVRGIGAAMKDKGYSVPTINKSLVALRGVLESAWRAGLIPDEDYRRIEIKNERGSSKVSGRALSKEEMDAIHENLPHISDEEQAVMALLCATGMRRVELARLRQEDLPDWNQPGAQRIVVRGKGEKSREIPIAIRWLPPIRRWWARLEPGAVAFPKFGGDTAMSRRTISYIVERFWKDAGLPEFSPHDLRRSFITRVCETSDISVAAKLAGHSSVNTTMIYDRRGKSAEDDAVKDL